MLDGEDRPLSANIADVTCRQTLEGGAGVRHPADWVRRVQDVEELARANHRELELQFRRMADMQAEIDALKKRVEAL
jgi:hypothetical protein